MTTTNNTSTKPNTDNTTVPIVNSMFAWVGVCDGVTVVSECEVVWGPVVVGNREVPKTSGGMSSRLGCLLQSSVVLQQLLYTPGDTRPHPLSSFTHICVEFTTSPRAITYSTAHACRAEHSWVSQLDDLQ